MKTHPMETPASDARRRLIKTALYVLLGNPHVLITAPLAIGLLVCALVKAGGDGARPGAAGVANLVTSYGCVAGIVLFAILAVTGLVLSVIYAWRAR